MNNTATKQRFLERLQVCESDHSLIENEILFGQFMPDTDQSVITRIERLLRSSMPSTNI